MVPKSEGSELRGFLQNKGHNLAGFDKCLAELDKNNLYNGVCILCANNKSFVGVDFFVIICISAQQRTLWAYRCKTRTEKPKTPPDATSPMRSFQQGVWLAACVQQGCMSQDCCEPGCEELNLLLG